MRISGWLCTIACVLVSAACGDEDAAGGGGSSSSSSSTSSGTGGSGGMTTSSGSGGSAGAGGVACAETCSGHGSCVLVDGAATCACEPGYYPVGLACLADPCELGGSCYYVDSDAGDDANDGSQPSPWRTLSRVESAEGALNPGDYVLFRRGGQWTSEGNLVINVTGTEASPVTYGAYGPLSSPLPQLRGIRVNNASHVTVRDVESVGSDGGPCINVTEADHVIIQGVTAHDCQNNGIHFGSQASHGVMIDNLVYAIPNNDALVVHSPTVLTEQTKVGDHFWIVDNRVPGPVAEQPVDVATGDDTVAGSRDIKVVGNRLSRGSNGCVALGHGTSVAWVVGNLMGNCTASETAYAIGVSGLHQANSGSDYRISGNVVFYNLMSAVNTYGEAPAVPAAWIEHNTFVSVIGQRAVFRAAYEPADITFNHNIVWTSAGHAHVGLPSPAVMTAMDYNGYVPGDDPACNIDGLSLVDWQSATGFDANSSCSPIPGLSLPSQGEVDDFDGWTAPAFLDRFIPDAAWSGCQDGIGAFDCNGEQRIELEPIPGYGDNNGYGWPGPLIVRQRYPLPS